MRVSGTLLAPALLVLIILLISAGRTDAAEPPAPLIVDADEVAYDEATQTVVATGSVRLSYRGFRLSADHVTVDLRTEQLAARGHVILVDAQGRELRGEVLTYDVRTEQAEMLKTETVLERVHIRSERIETKGTHVIAHEATFTTCDPDRPAYRVTASRIEVFPGERIVATHASLWLGRYRLFTLPVLVFSLKPGEGVRNIPRFGYNGPDGLWADYTYQYLPGPLRGALYGKYGTRSGFIVNNTLTYGLPAYAFTLVAGRAQNADLKIFDLAEFSFSTTPHALGGLPLLVDLGAAIGWFRETAPDLSTSRWLYRVGISTTPIPLGPRTQWKTSSSWQDAAYGQGSRQSVLSVNSAVTHQIDASSSLTLAYRLLNVDGATPFVFDRISTESRVHDLSLQYAQSRERAPGTTTTFNAGTTYYFREIPVLRGGTAVTFLPGPSPGKLRLWDEVEIKAGLELAFTCEEMSPLAFEQVFGSLALTAASTQYNPLEGGMLKKGWVHLQQYDQNDALFNTLQVFANLKASGQVDFAADNTHVKVPLRAAVLHSTLNSGTLA